MLFRSVPISENFLSLKFIKLTTLTTGIFLNFPAIYNDELIKAGIDHVFGPGTTLQTIIDHITTGVSKLRKI